MFISQSSENVKDLAGVCTRCVVTDKGLGADSGFPGGQSDLGKNVTQIATMLGPPLHMLPGMDILKKLAGKAGIDINPLSLSLASVTFGFSLLPGISSILGGLFKKATHFEDCTHWYELDSSIRDKATRIEPYEIDIVNNLPDASREYQLQHAVSIMTNPKIVSLLNKTRRKNSIINTFVRVVHSTPDLLKMECVVYAQSKGETYGVPTSRMEMDGYWDQIKEAARQKEYVETVTALESIIAPYEAMAKQKKTAILGTRSMGLVSGSDVAQSSTGVVGISKGGALILDPEKASRNLVLRRDAGKSTVTKVKR